MKKIILITLISVIGISTYGQKNFYSLSLSPGVAIPELDESLFYGNAAINFRHNDYLFSADIENMSSLLSGTYNNNQVGIYAGKSKGNRLARYDFQLGLTYMWRELHNWDEATQIVTPYIEDGIGLCFNGGIKLIPFRFVAIGVDAKLGYNTYIQGYFIPMLTLEIGKIQ